MALPKLFESYFIKEIIEIVNYQLSEKNIYIKAILNN